MLPPVLVPKLNISKILDGDTNPNLPKINKHVVLTNPAEKVQSHRDLACRNLSSFRSDARRVSYLVIDRLAIRTIPRITNRKIFVSMQEIIPTDNYLTRTHLAAVPTSSQSSSSAECLRLPGTVPEFTRANIADEGAIHHGSCAF